MDITPRPLLLIVTVVPMSTFANLYDYRTMNRCEMAKKSRIHLENTFSDAVDYINLRGNEFWHADILSTGHHTALYAPENTVQQRIAMVKAQILSIVHIFTRKCSSITGSRT